MATREQLKKLVAWLDEENVCFEMEAGKKGGLGTSLYAPTGVTTVHVMARGAVPDFPRDIDDAIERMAGEKIKMTIY